MRIITAFNLNDVVRTRTNLGQDLQGHERATFNAGIVSSIQISVDKNGELAEYSIAGIRGAYLEFELSRAFCPCGVELTVADVERNARDYSNNLVCLDCYYRLCEDAESDRQAEESYAELVTSGATSVVGTEDF